MTMLWRLNFGVKATMTEKHRPREIWAGCVSELRTLRILMTDWIMRATSGLFPDYRVARPESMKSAPSGFP